MTSRAIWRLEGVGLGRSGAARLRDVGVEIVEGVTAVIGQSGAGKTSLLNLLAGFERPDSGAVISFPSCSAGSAAAAMPLYWVPENGGLWGHLTARAHLEAVVPEGRAVGAIAVDRMLGAFDLEAQARSRPGTLSQGERSRLAVARALVSRAAALVMDEPFAGVDPGRLGRYWGVVREHLAATGASLVFSTHSPAAVLAEARRVIALGDGRVIFDGEVDDLYARPETPEQAASLGPFNWFEPPEAERWLGTDGARRVCLRPEQIEIAPDPEGPVRVRAIRVKGPTIEAEVARVGEAAGEGGSRERLRVTCRAGPNPPRPGERAVLRVLVAIVLATILSGCPQSSTRELTVKSMRVISIPAEGRKIPAPRAIAIGAANEAFVLDTAGRVLVFDAHRNLVRQWRMPESKAGNPEGVCVLRDGRVAVADTHYHRVVFFDAAGHAVSTLGREGRGPGEFIYPVAVALDDAENLYVCEYGSNDRVQKFSREGTFLAAFGGFGTGAGEFQRPSGIVWREGRVYVADAINNRIQVFTDSGKLEGVLAGGGGGTGGAPEAVAAGLRFPYGIALGLDGALWAVEYGAGRLTKMSLAGALLGRFGRPGTARGEFNTPWAVAVDREGRILVADTGNRRLVELDL